MTPVPEPASDVLAQIAAMLDPNHPKRAALVVPGNVMPDETRGKAHIVERPEGTLITTDPELAALYARRADDQAMAVILGYPEHKDDVVRNCRENFMLARAVQARDAAGNVLTEAFASPVGLGRTMAAIASHVPPGGQLVVMTPVDAIIRRLTLRAQEGAL